MTPYTLGFYHHLIALVKDGEIPESRIDLSVGRILDLKYRLGLFDQALPDPQLTEQIGGAEAHDISRKGAREAITLLKNHQSILPLPSNTRILLTGPGADALPPLHGAWSYTWQGNDENFYPESTKTLLQAMREDLGEANVSYVPGAGYSSIIDLAAVEQRAAEADMIIVALAEKPAVEQMGIIEELALPKAQEQLVRVAQKTGKPVILVLLENRPRILRDIEPGSAAILLAYYPGMFGAEAITEVLLGKVNPSGKLPFTYPRFSGSLEPYDHKASESQELAYAWTAFKPQWEFGHGLSYTRFEYRDLALDNTRMPPDGRINVSLTVKNAGKRPGTEVVQLYVSDLVASITPAVKRLKGFQRVELEPGEEKRVEFAIEPSMLTFIGIDQRPRMESGDFEVAIGPLKTGFTVE